MKLGLQLFCLVLVSVTFTHCEAQNTAIPAQYAAFLKGNGVEPVAPARTLEEAYPGQIVLGDSKGSNTIQVPIGDRPKVSEPLLESLGSVTKNDKLTLGLALKALFAWTITGDLNHQSSTTIKQIDAKAFTYADDQKGSSVLSSLKEDIDGYKARGLTVYQVNKVLVTDDISFKFSRSLGGTLSVSGGNNVTKDSQATCSSNADDSNKNKTTTSQQNSTASDQSKGTGSTKTKNTSQNSTSGKNAATNSMPSVQTSFCSAGDTQFTLKTAQPMVFAVQLYQVEWNAKKNLYEAIPKIVYTKFPGVNEEVLPPPR